MHAGNLYHDVNQLVGAGELADLGPKRRPTAWSIEHLDEKLGTAFQDIRLTPALKDLIRAGVYLWHDHLQEAHQIAQDIETGDGSLWHAIMHRREPDYWNSKYWFRRVGAHPSFLALATRAGELLAKAGESDLHSRLAPNKTWDPFAFVDTVEEALNGQFRSKTPLLQQIQQLEFQSFFENLANRI
jgi:hypothetical protein